MFVCKAYSQENFNDSSEIITNQDRTYRGLFLSSGFNGGFIAEIGITKLSVREAKYLFGNEGRWLPKRYTPLQVNLSIESRLSGTTSRHAVRFGSTFGISVLSFSYFNFLYVTDFIKGSLVYRPEIGINLGDFRLTYGYLIPLSNKSFIQSDNRTFLSMSYVLKLGKPFVYTSYLNRQTQKTRNTCTKE